jgi:hypothetical protein
MLPNTKITIKLGGKTVIDGLEQSDQCYKLAEAAAEAGKIIKKDKKDHPPVTQSVHTKGV